MKKFIAILISLVIIKDSAGTQYTIDSFGGPIGPNALLQPF